jgi:hypothetical protein
MAADEEATLRTLEAYRRVISYLLGAMSSVAMHAAAQPEHLGGMVFMVGPDPAAADYATRNGSSLMATRKTATPSGDCPMSRRPDYSTWSNDASWG